MRNSRCADRPTSRKDNAKVYRADGAESCTLNQTVVSTLGALRISPESVVPSTPISNFIKTLRLYPPGLICREQRWLGARCV
jgi:hypothetical protein